MVLDETRKLYELRKPVYEKIYDIKIILNRKSSEEIIDEILEEIYYFQNVYEGV